MNKNNSAQSDLSNSVIRITEDGLDLASLDSDLGLETFNTFHNDLEEQHQHTVQYCKVLLYKMFGV